MDKQQVPPEKRLIGRKEQALLLGGVSTRTIIRYGQKYEDFPREIELSPTTKLRDRDEVLAWVETRKAKVAA